jgi:hypothetical protein
MTMTPRISRLVLTSHITFSVGWLGAVAVFIVLAITALTSQDTQLSRSACLAMELSAWFVIIPFCFASLFTGVVQAVGTKWGLFKHYWIVVKLFLTIVSTILLLLHMNPISALARAATDPSFLNSQHSGEIIDLIAKAGVTIVVLLAITTISVYKPWGKIQLTQNTIKRTWRFYALIGLVSLILLFISMHLFGGGMHGH